MSFKSVSLSPNILPSNKIELLNFGQILLRGTVVSRPSDTIKSPYVADVITNVFKINHEFTTNTNNNKSESTLSQSKILQKRKLIYQSISKEIRSHIDDIQLAHCPALDCAGMINPGSVIYMTENQSSSSKTKYSIQYVEELRENNVVELVGCHPNSGEKIGLSMIKTGILSDDICVLMNSKQCSKPQTKRKPKYAKNQIIGDDKSSNYAFDLNNIKSQQTFGNSRFDYSVPSIDKKILYLIEVKNVVGADYIESQVPLNRSEIGVYTIALPSKKSQTVQRNAIFPHGSHKNGIPVVSDRAIKHVHELTELQGSTTSLGENEPTKHSSSSSSSSSSNEYAYSSIQSVILFVINRSDCHALRPCHEADTLFAQVLKKAQHKGVLLLAYDINPEIDPNNDNNLTGKVFFGKSVPVEFHDSIEEKNIDETLLQQVLAYNAENGSKRSSYKSPTKKAKKT